MTASASNVKRVAVIEWDRDIQNYLKHVIQSAGDFKLAGDFLNFNDAYRRILNLRPDVVLVGIRTPLSKGIEGIKRLKHLIVSLKVVVITGMAHADSVELLVNAGAETCLIRPVSPCQCLVTLRCAGRSRSMVEVDRPQPNGVHVQSPNRHSPLSRREHDVMMGLEEGLLYKEISDKLGISYSAVHKYQHRLFVKLHVSNRSEAIRAWHRNGNLR